MSKAGAEYSRYLLDNRNTRNRRNRQPGQIPPAELCRLLGVKGQRGVRMKRYIPASLLCGLVLAPILTAQTTEPDRRAQFATAIERRLQGQQEMDLGADSITLTGTLLHLKGHARIIWLPDTVIRAEEIKIDAGTVELIGNVNASLGSSSGVPLPTPPKIQYR
jgi:hypothetical protein